MAYEIDFSPNAEEHLESISARARGIIIKAIEQQLPHDPLVETRNRKWLRNNPLAPWELRVGNWRVFYDVAEGQESLVRIVAIGEKVRNELWIAGKRIEL